MEIHQEKMSLISGSGTVDLLYTATSGDDTAEIKINARRCW